MGILNNNENETLQTYMIAINIGMLRSIRVEFSGGSRNLEGVKRQNQNIFINNCS